MVEHTETICQQFADKLFQCVYLAIFGVGT